MKFIMNKHMFNNKKSAHFSVKSDKKILILQQIIKPFIFNNQFKQLSKNKQYGTLQRTRISKFERTFQ